MAGIEKAGEQQASVLLAQGEINRYDQAVIMEVLGRFGLTGGFVPAAEYEALQGRDMGDRVAEAAPTVDFHFSSITSPTDIIVREHLEDLVGNQQFKVNKMRASRAIHALLDGNAPTQGHTESKLRLFDWVGRQPDSTKKWVQSREPVPMPGIIVVKREDYGVPPYNGSSNAKDTTILAQYGIVAGSVLRALNPVVVTQLGDGETASILRRMSLKLHQQIQPTEGQGN